MLIMTPVRWGGLSRTERIVRAVAGAASMGAAGWIDVRGWATWIALSVGLVGVGLLATALRGYCPLYARLGLGQHYTADLFRVHRRRHADDR